MLIEPGFTLLLALMLGLVARHDFRHMRVPDGLSAAICLCGLLYWQLAASAQVLPQSLSATLFGSGLWLLREAHARFSGRIGLGLGDVKLAAAGAVWISPPMLPLLLFAASLAGLAHASVQALAQGGSLRQARIPFAPSLAASILFCWLLERWP